MDIGRSITYVFQDPSWLKKVAIGGLLSFIPIFGWLVVAGYWLRVVRNVATGPDLPLPEWDDFGGDFVRGLKVVVVGIVWALPLIIISFCTAIPAGIADGSNDGAEVATGALALAGYCLTTILSIIVAFIQPVYMSRLAIREDIGNALDFGGIIAEARRYPVPLLIVVVMSFALQFLAYFGLILCIIGVVFTIFLSYIMLAHLYGQVRRMIDGEPTVDVIQEPIPTI